MTDLTAEELTIGISNAIKARNFEAVVDMLHALVFLDPQRAQDIYDTLARVSLVDTSK
jgi:hypothetical protein